MKKRKKAARKKAFDIHKLGNIALVVIFALAAVSIYVPLDAAATYIVLGVMGAIIAILNIRKAEEQPFLLAVIALMVLTTVVYAIPIMPYQVGEFLVRISIPFGIAGLIVALGLIIKIAWEL
ncbi:MAG: hypothetical protein ACE5J7_02230 [Candidatus Aenigmatarchaeota archaeon]